MRDITLSEITNNNQITIDDITTPLIVSGDDKFNVYIGISATSLNSVHLKFTGVTSPDYEYDVSVQLERLTQQTNMYALHLGIKNYSYVYQEPDNREFTFNLSAYTNGNTSGVTSFTITQNGCKDCKRIVYVCNSDEITIEEGYFGSGVTVVRHDYDDDTDVGVITCSDCITEMDKNCGFRDISGLTEVILPDELAIIGESTFEMSNDLTKVRATGARSIGAYTFEHCAFYAIIIDDGISESLEKIDAYNRMGGCLTLSDALSATDIKSFAHNSNLIEVEIPSELTEISREVFSYSPNLENVTFRGNTISIGYGAFYRCTSLTSVTIPNSVISIGDAAFQGCSGLTSVTIGESATSIGNYAFENCSGLTSVTIPNRVTGIGFMAFSYCTSLTSVTIGNSVARIGNYAFSGCTGLTKVTCESINPPTITSDTFDSNTLTNGILHVPSECEVIYRNRGWSFSNIVEDAA